MIASNFPWDLKIVTLAAGCCAMLHFAVVEGTFHSYHLPEEDQYKMGSNEEYMAK